jgi:uncharacterized protein YpuA (DUF1002 family)
MKLSEFRKLIREEVRKVIKENRNVIKEYYRPMDENIVILLNTAAKGKPAEKAEAKRIINAISDEFNIKINPADIKGSIRTVKAAAQRNSELEGDIDSYVENLLDEFGAGLESRAKSYSLDSFREF